MDWVGPLQALDRGSLFPVQFSRVRDGVEKITDDEAIYEARKTVAPVGIGYAPILQPGTIWEDGSLKTRWSHNLTSIETHVSPEVPILGSYARDDAGFLLPKSQFAIDGRTAGSNFALFEGSTRGEQITILVPCMEIYRFYYGHSSPLSYRTLRGDLVSAPHTLYDVDASGIEPSGHAKIELSTRCDRSDAYTLARFALSEIGLRRAKAIVTRGAIAVGGTIPIDVLPPFNGPWQFRAAGKWIRRSGHRTFLVFAIVRCSAPPPFTDLEVAGGIERVDSDTRIEREVQGPRDAVRRRIIAPVGTTWVTSGDPDVHALPRRLPTLDSQNRLPQIPVYYIAKRHRTGKRSGRFRQSDLPVTRTIVAVSDESMPGGPDRGIFTADDSVEERLPESRDFLDLFQDALSQLPDVGAAAGLSCIVERHFLDFTNVFDQEPPPWTTMGRRSGEHRLIHIARIRINEYHALVIELQRRPGTPEEFRTLIACTTSLVALSDAEQTALLSRLAMCQGHLHDLTGVRILQPVRLSGTNHREQDTPERFAGRLLNKMLMLIGDLGGVVPPHRF